MRRTSSCRAPRSRTQKVCKPPDYLETHHPRLWLLAAKLQVVCTCQIFHPNSKPVITDRFQRSTEKNNCVCSGATRRAALSRTFQREKQARLLLMEFDSWCLHLLLICLVEIGRCLAQLTENISVGHTEHGSAELQRLSQSETPLRQCVSFRSRLSCCGPARLVLRFPFRAVLVVSATGQKVLERW